jgi:hypothetical protein
MVVAMGKILPSKAKYSVIDQNGLALGAENFHPLRNKPAKRELAAGGPHGTSGHFRHEPLRQ